ncbi:MAG: hypothetical protein GX496_02335 [Firmicutes bacterium]|nr:hypothetical protein [Bacillota bacterium]
MRRTLAIVALLLGLVLASVPAVASGGLTGEYALAGGGRVVTTADPGLPIWPR